MIRNLLDKTISAYIIVHWINVEPDSPLSKKGLDNLYSKKLLVYYFLIKGDF